MKIFISYSTTDIKVVELFSNVLSQYGEVKYWAENRVLGEDSWKTIFSWIDSSDVVIALITGNTLTRAMAVGQEIGYAKGKKKIIPVVESSIPATELGCLSGITYQPIDVFNPIPAVMNIAGEIESIIVDQSQKQEAFVRLLVIGFLIWLFSQS